jgi:hypothetical protein
MMRRVVALAKSTLHDAKEALFAAAVIAAGLLFLSESL